jgi:integrase
MLNVHKRGHAYHVDFRTGVLRVRCSLGTRNQDAACRLVHRLEIALSEGSDSVLWAELEKLLPESTYIRFAQLVDVKQRQSPTWSDLQEGFRNHMEQRIKIGKLQNSTKERYEVPILEFDKYLAERKITELKDITKPVVETFKVWRIGRIKKQKNSRGATGLILDAAILHRVFAFALENEMVEKNPVRMEGRPGENPEHGAEPFTAHDLSRLREHSGDDLLTFLLLRWTGLRGSDAVSLTWGEVHFETKEIERVTQKRRKKVLLPIHTELLFALESDHERRRPQPIDRVLLNPSTGRPLSRPRLYQRVVAFGKRAGVANAHPHRFRDTLAVDMLSRGASPYDVAKMLGDTIETVEKHYTPFVKELRERVRSILETDSGLESTVTPVSQSQRSIQ